MISSRRISKASTSSKRRKRRGEIDGEIGGIWIGRSTATGHSLISKPSPCNANCLSIAIVALLLLILLPDSNAQQQNFLSFIQPFLGGAAGGGGQPAAAAAQPQPPPQMEQPGGFGGIGQFVDMFKNVRAGLGQPAGSREERAQQLANTAQTLLSAFSNSGSPQQQAATGGAAGPAANAATGGGGFGEYLNLGSNFGLGSALQNRRRRRKRQSPLPNLFSLLEQVAQRASSKRQKQQQQQQQQMDQYSSRHHQSAPPLSRQSRPVQSGSPIVRLTDNFGRNFFQMLDELYEYANMPSPGGQSTLAPARLTPPATLAPSPTTPSLQQLFPWLPTLPTLAPPPVPFQLPTPAPPSQFGIGSETAAAAAATSGEATLLNDAPQPAETARDMLDANKLMRAFLRTMAKDAGKQPLRPMPVHNDGTETGRNRPLMDQLFESDILLTSRQMKAIVLAEAERKNGGGRRRKRKVITGAAYRWPKGQPIPYSFREPDKKWHQLIESGLRLWEAETCLRFREGAGGAKDRVEFIRGSGCYSSVGRTGGLQKISIGYGCEDKGIVSHEVGHALGFWHEQSRPDRDQYIRLEDRYIMGGTEGNFAKRSDLESDGMGLPYDLGSVMHYGPNAFTTDWDHITIVTKDDKYQHSIGQRQGPSFIDVKQINRLYCHHSCQGTPVVCQNGGYADPNNCLQCKCPPGLGGPSCANVEPSEDLLCGGDIQATGVWQHLTHKGRRRCIWRIRTDGQHRIRFILDHVDYPCSTTCHSFVELKHNSDFQQVGFRACCEEKAVEVLSEQAELLVISDPREMSGRDGAFSLRYIADSGSGAPLPKPPPPAWVPGRENRPFRGVANKGGAIEKFILNAIPRVRDPDRPLESVASILTDYFAASVLGVSKRK